MKKLFYILITVFFVNCINKSEQKSLNDPLNQIIIQYQKKYPANVKNLESKYIYGIQFLKEKKDTIIILQRSSSGILRNIKSIGVYKSEIIYPTLIIDEDKLGIKFYDKFKLKQIQKEFYLDENSSFPERFPPIYKYRIKNKNIELIKIDTIWNSWD